MQAVIAVANQKGGVGKTTLAVNLAVALGRTHRVLLIDLDPQSNAADMVGLDLAGYPGLLEIFEERASVFDVIVPTEFGFDLLPAGDESRGAAVEQALVTRPAREGWLGRTLDGQVDGYDRIILDCPPSLGQLTTNALVIADIVLCPVSLMSAHSVKGANETARSVIAYRKLGAGFDHIPLPVLVWNFVDRQATLSVAANREEALELGLEHIDVDIPKMAALNNAEVEGRPLLIRQPGSRAASAVWEIAENLERRLGALDQMAA